METHKAKLKRLERESDLITIRMLRLGLERDQANENARRAENLFAEAQRDFARARIAALSAKYSV